MTQAMKKELFNKNKRAIKAALPEVSLCPYCNSLMSKDTKSPYSFVSIDHKVAYSKGGSDEMENLIPCCGNCNTKKGNNPQAIFFRLNSPKVLTDEEYIFLNDVVTIFQRIEYLYQLKELVVAGKVSEAIDLSKEAQVKTTSSSFFNKLTQGIKNNSNADYITKEVIVRLKAELDKMSTLKENLSGVDYALYCLLESGL